jgi:aldose 1-epimerase
MALRLTAGRLCLELRPEIGGCVSAAQLRLGARDFDLMRPLDGRPSSPPDALRAAMFSMAPFANCIRDNRFVFDGRSYFVSPNMAGSRLNFHGSGWRSAWRVASVDSRSAEIVLKDGRVDDVYCYAAAQRFRMNASGITVETEIANRGERRMPFSFGQHPWFPTHSGALARFTASSLWLCDAEGQAKEQVSISRESDYSAPRPPPGGYHNVCYAGWDGRADIEWPRENVRLSITADPVFSHLMLHAPADGEPIFCLEPQTAAPCSFDGLNAEPHPAGVHILEPGGRVSGVLRFDVHH